MIWIFATIAFILPIAGVCIFTHWMVTAPKGKHRPEAVVDRKALPRRIAAPSVIRERAAA